jgi:RAT1-interacting protein
MYRNSLLLSRVASHSRRTAAHEMASTEGGRGRGVGNALCEIDVRAWSKSESAASTLTHVSEPYEVACFSRFPDRSIAYGSRQQLKRFKDPPMNATLAAGFASYIPKNEPDAGDGVLPVVEMLQHAGFDVDTQADIISYRNNLNKIANTPYNTRDPWEIDAVQVGRCVYLDIRHLPEPPPDHRLQLLRYQGYKFEALCTEGHSSTGVVDANEEWCAAIRIRIGNARIVISSEIDAEMPSAGGPHDPKKNSFVELKTTRMARTNRDYANLYSKYQKWWVQSWLAGVRTIFVGIRDDAGNLIDVEHLSTRTLPRIAKDGMKRISLPGRESVMAFDPMCCVNFIEYVCEHMRRCCGEWPGRTVRFAFNPRSGILSGYLPDNKDDARSTTLGERIREVRLSAVQKGAE